MAQTTPTPQCDKFQLARQNVGAASAAGVANMTHEFLLRTTHTRAQVEAAGYFNTVRTRLTKGSLIRAVMDVGNQPVTRDYVVNDAGSSTTDVVVAPFGSSGGGVVTETGTTVTVTAAAHAGRTTVLSRAAGQAVTLPAATGSGDKYKFVVGTTITSNTTTIKVADATDTMFGNAIQSQDGGATLQMFEAAAGDDTITFDGSTKGGIKGDIVELEDIAANEWSVRIVAAGTGTEATPFSATVS